MRRTDPVTGREFVTKRRRRFDGARMPRELAFSCYRGLPLLGKDRSRHWFVDALRAARTAWPIDLWAWVVMPEHVHLLVAPRSAGIEVGRFIGLVKEKTARAAIAWLTANAPAWLDTITVKEGARLRRRFWQPGGGYDCNIDNEETLSYCLHYIHLNPVRRRLAMRPEEWIWSSAGWYAGQRPALLEIDASLPMRYCLD